MTRACPAVHDGRPCLRPVAPDSPSGIRHAMCAEDERAALTNAWHDDARAGVLRAAIVGGLPLDITTRHPDSTLSVGHEGSPRCSVSCAQRVAGVATQPARQRAY